VHLYAAQGGAAEEDEWMVSGGYAVCDLTTGHRSKPCHCHYELISLKSSPFLRRGAEKHLLYRHPTNSKIDNAKFPMLNEI
jgi:hypothetical protein